MSDATPRRAEWPTPDEIAALAATIPPLVHFGTSSWTYPGWRGLIYQRDYPATRSSVRQLAEYARWPLVSTVGVDSFFYSPATERVLTEYAAALPPGFRCVTKVWERITARTFSSPRDTHRRGELNPEWLNAELFINEVLGPMQSAFSDHMGPIVLEFQSIAGDQFVPEQFFAALDRFFGALPTGLPYAVEVRNAEYLQPAYFAVLRDHSVAHLFNSWTRMPAIGEQLQLHDSITANFVVSRALLRPGRSYAQAVDAFAPYDRIQDPNPELRADLVGLARTAINLRIPAYVIVNNRAEGCSPLTIAAVASLLAATVGSASEQLEE